MKTIYGEKISKIISVTESIALCVIGTCEICHVHTSNIVGLK
jgi:hypothetical protein